MDKTWLFITGMARSGTTLAKCLISLHPNACITHETNMAVEFYKYFDPAMGAILETHGNYFLNDVKLTFGNDYVCKNREMRLPRLFSPPLGSVDGGDAKFNKLQSIGLKPEHLTPLARHLCESTRDFLVDDSILVFGDKNPSYLFDVELILKIFPDSKIILTTRNIENIKQSITKARWFGSPDAINNYIESCIPILNKISKENNVYNLSLESLEANPEFEICKLLKWIGLDLQVFPLEKAIDIVNNGNVNRLVTQQR